MLTKPINQINQFVDYTVIRPVNVLYTGKLNIGRDQSLVKIVDVLEKGNYSPEDLQINVYTNSSLSSELKDRLEKSGFCHIHPPVPQTEVFKLQKQADILLFLESLSNKDLTARLSFSTKLTDYFAAGKCVWAVGNSDLGPISYIQTEDAGFVSSDKVGIERALNTMMNDVNIIPLYSKKAFDCGQKNHSYQKVVECLKNIIG